MSGLMHKRKGSPVAGGRVFSLTPPGNGSSTHRRQLAPSQMLKWLVITAIAAMGLLLMVVMNVEVKHYDGTQSSSHQTVDVSRKSKVSRQLKKAGDDTTLNQQRKTQFALQKIKAQKQLEKVTQTQQQIIPTQTQQIIPTRERPGWTRAAEIPIEFIESSCVWHANEFWCVGGYQNGETCSYNPTTDTWTLRPRMAIKIEHIFNTAVSVNDGNTLAVIGGVGFPPRGVDNNKPFKVRIQLLDTNVPDDEMKWRLGDNETECSEMDIGGISTCTIAPVGGEYYCTFGSDYNFIRTDTMRFFSFNPKTLRFRQLPEPPAFYSHVTLLADEVRKRVIYLASRIVRKKLQTDEPSRTTYFYDVEKGEWNVDAPQEIPDYMPSLEGRTAYQHPSTKYGYLMGGQNNAGTWVSELIYKFTLSDDPSDRDIHFEWWSRQPGMAKFGSSVREIPPGSGKLIFVGGGLSVGPYPTNEVWFWDERKMGDTLNAYHLQRKTAGDTRPQPKFVVLSATFGHHDVTDKVQKLLDDGWTHFNSRAMPDFQLLDHWQWMINRRKGVNVVRKMSNNKKYRTGWPLEALVVTIVESDGYLRTVMCPRGSGCKFSFWEEEEEYKVFKKLEHFPQWDFPNPNKIKIQ